MSFVPNSYNAYRTQERVLSEAWGEDFYVEVKDVAIKLAHGDNYPDLNHMFAAAISVLAKGRKPEEPK